MEKKSLHKILNIARWTFAVLAVIFVAYYFYSSEASTWALFIGEIFWFLAVGLTAIMIYAQFYNQNRRSEKNIVQLALLISFVGIAIAFGALYIIIYSSSIG